MTGLRGSHGRESGGNADERDGVEGTKLPLTLGGETGPSLSETRWKWEDGREGTGREACLGEGVDRFGDGSGTSRTERPVGVSPRAMDSANTANST